MIVGEVDGRGSGHLFDANKNLLGLVWGCFVRFIGHSLLLKYFPDADLVLYFLHFDFGSGLPEDLH